MKTPAAGKEKMKKEGFMPTSDECKNTSDELYGYIAKLLADQPFFKNLVGGLKAGNIEV